MSADDRFPRPKVLLVDLADEHVEACRQAGYRVASGTLGKPFAVPQSNGFVRVPQSAHLPNFSEQEVVVLQQLQPTPLEAAPAAPPETGENAVWSRTRSGVVDPRPWAAHSYSEDAQRIVAHGGIFVAFCYPREQAGLVWAQRWGQRVDVAKELDWSVWDLLPGQRAVTTSVDFGLEIEAPSVPEVLAVLRPFLLSAKFACTLDIANWAERQWVSLATNKYGASVAGVLRPEKKTDGWVFLLPQVEDPGACIVALLNEALPALAPGLFPHAEKAAWLHDQPYELPEVTALQDEIAQVRSTAREAEKRLHQSVERERRAHGWLHTLLTGTDDELVDAVKRGLDELGLGDVRKVDDEAAEAAEGRRREDIQVWGRSPILLVEVKGIAGLPKEASSLQVTKYLVPRIKQWDRTDVAGLAVINQQRALPALRRENVNTFQDDVLVNAEHQGFGLLTTLDLFRLLRNKRRWNWPDETVADLLYHHGRIRPIPTHYEPVGVIEGFFEKAEVVCIRVNDGDFAVGDRLAFLLPIEYHEQNVESIQENDAAVDRASSGTHVGVKTSLSRGDARDGVLVYRVRADTDRRVGSEAPTSA